jgi:cell division protein FtsW (lipid II flippase)
MKWAASILIFCVAVLIGMGMVMLYSSSMNMEMNKSAVGAHYLLSQLAWSLRVRADLLYHGRLHGLPPPQEFSPWLLGLSAVLLLLVFARLSSASPPKGRIAGLGGRGCRIFNRRNWPSWR